MKINRKIFSKNVKYPYFFLLLSLLAIIPLSVFISQQQQTVQQQAQTPPASQPLGPGGSWNLVFDDEFSGTALDATKWSVCYPWDCHTGGNGELMVYAPQYATLANGILTIKAVNQQTCDGGYCAKYGSSLLQTGPPHTGNPSKFTFTYGFAEARLQVPYGTGYFPAFWLLGPKSEIDLMEVFGNKTNFNCGVFLNNYKSHWPCQTHGANTPGSYHTFGVDWQPTLVTFYYDGTPVGSTTDPTKIPTDAVYILLNFAIGANFMTPPDSTTVFPAILNADYVRVWKTGAGGGTQVPKPTVVTPTYVCAGSQNGICLTVTPIPTTNNGLAFPTATSVPSLAVLSPIASGTPSISAGPTATPTPNNTNLFTLLLGLILKFFAFLLSLLKRI